MSKRLEAEHHTAHPKTGDIDAFNAHPFDTMMMRSNTLMQAAVAWQQEALRFVSSRLAWDAKVTQAVLACKTPAEFVEIQKDWLQSTTRDYADEANRFFKLLAHAPTWGRPPAAPETKEVSQ